MGDIADMMLEGILCEQCGVYLEHSEGEFPQLCPSCLTIEFKPPTKVKCPKCGKKVKEAGLANHMRDVHNRG